MGLKEQKIEDIRKQLGDIIENIEQSALQKVKLHELELNMFRSLLELGLTLLSYYIFTAVSYTHLTLPTTPYV